MLHLLQWHYQPQARSGSWRSTIREQRSRLRRVLQYSPSLTPLVPHALQEEYPEARQRACDETDMPLAIFPETCPWTPAEVLDVGFWPEA